MKSKLVIGKDSALPLNNKMRTLTQESFRQLHNTRENVLEEYKESILSDYMQKLHNSGYNESERLYILKGGLNTYEKIKELERLGKRKFYRAPEERELSREKKKNKSSWYINECINNNKQAQLSTD